MIHLKTYFSISFLSSCLLLDFVQSQSIPSYQQKSINKIKDYLTTFLTDSQLQTICDIVANDTAQGKNTSQMATDLENYVLGSLTPTQLTTGLSIINALDRDFGSVSNAETFITPVLDIFSNDVMPFYNQVIAEITKMNVTENKGITAITKQMYHMMNSFATFDRVQTIMQRVAANSMSQANFTFFVNDLGPAPIFFSKYNLTMLKK